MHGWLWCVCARRGVVQRAEKLPEWSNLGHRLQRVSATWLARGRWEGLALLQDAANQWPSVCLEVIFRGITRNGQASKQWAGQRRGWTQSRPVLSTDREGRQTKIGIHSCKAWGHETAMIRQTREQ